MNDCIFCKIIRGEIPSYKIYEDDETLAFLSTGPNNPGHTLVIPKDHVENVYEMDENHYGPVMRAVKKVAVAVKKGVNADGINVHMNNDGPAGQVIFHAHIHIIPRFKGDGLTHWPGKQYKVGEAESIAPKIQAAL
jgi:histidine triad (HIT) family protein